MNALLARVLKEKHEDRNDIISSLNEIKQVQQYQRSCLASLDVCLAHLEIYLQCDLKPLAAVDTSV